MKTCAIAVFLFSGVVAHTQEKTYIALGDSVAWGYQPNSTSRGNGDKGYVRLFADYLGTQQAGVRPRLINLGIPGESTASFFNTSEIGGLLNSNYPILFRNSQADTFRSKMASERNAGRVVAHVTFALGANDLLDLQTSAFFSQSFEQQVAIVDATLQSAAVKLDSALTIIRQECPQSILKIPGYYSPYGAFPGSQEDRIGRYAIPKLNRILQSLAKRYHAAFAQIYRPFIGSELSLTWIGEDDVHPRDAGYALIAQVVILAQFFSSPGP